MGQYGRDGIVFDTHPVRTQSREYPKREKEKPVHLVSFNRDTIKHKISIIQNDGTNHGQDEPRIPNPNR